MANITDVSRLANVSKATVSRVLSGTRGVREESRLAVLQAVEQLNYRPNAMARSLANQSTDCIGVILSARETGRITSLLPLLERELSQVNRHLLIRFAEGQAQQQAAADELLGGRCDAIVMIGASAPLARDERLIQLDGVAAASDINLSYDFVFACESACRFLLGKSHRQIALLVESLTTPSGLQMVQGYQQALQHQSLPYNRQLVIEAGDNQQALLGLLNRYLPFTALVVQHDAQAAEAMRLLREFNLQVPQDVSIVSLEGSTLASQLNPALTCIEYPSERLAQEAVRLTLQVLGGHALPSAEQQKFTGRLVTRDSVQNR